MHLAHENVLKIVTIEENADFRWIVFIDFFSFSFCSFQ
jgi:hypothetical protein